MLGRMSFHVVPGMTRRPPRGMWRDGLRPFTFPMTFSGAPSLLRRACRDRSNASVARSHRRPGSCQASSRGRRTRWSSGICSGDVHPCPTSHHVSMNCCWSPCFVPSGQWLVRPRGGSARRRTVMGSVQRGRRSPHGQCSSHWRCVRAFVGAGSVLPGHALLIRDRSRPMQSLPGQSRAPSATDWTQPAEFTMNGQDGRDGRSTMSIVAPAAAAITPIPRGTSATKQGEATQPRPAWQSVISLRRAVSGQNQLSGRRR